MQTLIQPACTHSPRAADTFIDFENPPELPSGTFARAAKKQITLSTFTPANTLLPEDMHCNVSAAGLCC
jgi:hypothetical protein